MNTRFAAQWAQSARELWELDLRRSDVLLIGSQLVSGSVGMSASIPIYDAAGIRTATIPTIILSNMPNYPVMHAFNPDAQWITDALVDLSNLGVFDEIDTIHTGYFANAEQIVAVAGHLKNVLDSRPDLRIIVDPTIGDYDVGVYTAPDVAPALREHLLPLATGLTPNKFEFEHLTTGDEPLDQLDAEATAQRARQLLSERTEWVIVTGNDSAGLEQTSAAGTPHVPNLIVTRDDCTVVAHEQVKVATKGSGDVFTAGIVCALHSGRGITDAVADASAVVADRLTRRTLL